MIPVRRSLTALFAFWVLANNAPAQQIQIGKDNRTVAITATDSARAEADTALVHIGFTQYAPAAPEAYAAASKTSSAIIDALKHAGVPESAIESESQTISEVEPFQLQNLPPEERQRRRFSASQSWTVKTPASKAASTLNVAVNAGANKSGTIDWTVANEDSLQAEAAAKALRRARLVALRRARLVALHRARLVALQMAQGLGVTLGELIYASNEVPSPAIPMMRGLAQGSAGGILGQAAMVPPLSIYPQQVSRTATVYAVFALQ
jgi:uncharacterized protein YggE